MASVMPLRISVPPEARSPASQVSASRRFWIVAETAPRFHRRGWLENSMSSSWSRSFNVSTSAETTLRACSRGSPPMDPLVSRSTITSRGTLRVVGEGAGGMTVHRAKASRPLALVCDDRPRSTVKPGAKPATRQRTTISRSRATPWSSSACTCCASDRASIRSAWDGDSTRAPSLKGSRTESCSFARAAIGASATET